MWVSVRMTAFLCTVSISGLSEARAASVELYQEGMRTGGETRQFLMIYIRGIIEGFDWMNIAISRDRVEFPDLLPTAEHGAGAGTSSRYIE